MSRETIDFDPQAQFTDAGDKQMFAQFYMHFIPDVLKTEEENRPIYKDTVFVRIFAPGDRNNIVDRPIRDTDQFRFPAQWARFKAGEDQRASGTPLEIWPVVTKGMAEELKFFGFHTVEQLANASDEVCSKKMGLVDLKNKANLYLKVAAGDTKPIAEMSREMTELKAQIETLTANLADAVSRIPKAKA
jgi:hypothetical protein